VARRRALRRRICQARLCPTTRLSDMEGAGRSGAGGAQRPLHLLDAVMGLWAAENASSLALGNEGQGRGSRQHRLRAPDRHSRASLSRCWLTREVRWAYNTACSRHRGSNRATVQLAHRTLLAGTANRAVYGGLGEEGPSCRRGGVGGPTRTSTSHGLDGGAARSGALSTRFQQARLHICCLGASTVTAGDHDAPLLLAQL